MALPAKFVLYLFSLAQESIAPPRKVFAPFPLFALYYDKALILLSLSAFGVTVWPSTSGANGLRPMRASLTGPNSIDPGRMTAPERLAEIAEILAAGLMRLRARQSSSLSPDSGESSLDCFAHQSGHADALKRNGGLD